MLAGWVRHRKEACRHAVHLGLFQSYVVASLSATATCCALRKLGSGWRARYSDEAKSLSWQWVSGGRAFGEVLCGICISLLMLTNGRVFVWFSFV